MALKEYSDTNRDLDFTWTSDDRARVVLHDPILWALARAVPERAPCTPGRPKQYPVSVFVLFFLLAGALGSHRAAASWIGRRDNWRRIRKVWATHGIELHKMPPTRGQCLYNRNVYLAPYHRELEAVVERDALERAQGMGMLVSTVAATAEPRRDCVVSGDATVPAMPMRESVFKKRRAAGQRLDFKYHIEGGNRPVFGSKFYMQSARAIDESGASMLNSRIILAVEHVASNQPGGEAAVAVRSLLDLKKRAPGLLGARYDGALRGVHLDELMKAGLAVVNPTHDGIKRRALAYVTCEHVDRDSGDECIATHQLYTEDGWIGVLEVLADANASVVFTRLGRERVVPRRNVGEYRWYVVVTLPCGHAHHVRITSTDDDRAAGYNRAEHIRMHPLNRPGCDGGSGYGIAIRVWSLPWVA